MKYAVVTFGCRVNQADSFVIEDGLRARGLVDAPAHDADLVIVNSCSVTASADQGTRQTIRRIARDNPSARIVVTGCYATRQPDEVAALPNVLRVVSNPEKDTLLDVLDSQGLTTAQRFAGGDGACGATLHPGLAGRTALTLRVQTGCDQICSYCIIPSTRGRGRSLPLDRVRREIRVAVAAGYREIAMAGVHLGSYGRDLADGTTLETLVAELAAWPGDVRFRISSLEPMDCTPAVVAMVADSVRLAAHFHLPLQHGSDAMLRAMRRPYTAAAFSDLLGSIHDRLPHAAIGTDVIVGFPGETDDQFARTLELIERLPLSHVHVFPYSDRPGTEASRLARTADGATIRERGRLIREAATQASHRFQAGQVGTRHRALTVEDGTRAVTGNYLKLSIPAGHARNEWVDVTVGGRPGALTGTLNGA